jgi:hypothetical protein
MERIQLLDTSHQREWLGFLAKSYQYDFYHLPQYHALAERRGEGAARLVVYQDGEHFIALPLLLRPLETIEGLSKTQSPHFDATSVYGYAGPVASHENIPAEVIAAFQMVVGKQLNEMNVVSVFARLHPLLRQDSFLECGELVPAGQTVSIDLTKPDDLQRAEYRKSLRYDIKRLQKTGAVCTEDREAVYLDEFIEGYYDAMRRVEAQELYFFDRDYFASLFSTLGDRIHLFVVRMNEELMGAGLFVECNGIVQYHLSADRERFRKLAPSKLMLDAVRIWATERGHRLLHLGGGVGSQDDSLFLFKAGFSHRRHRFSTWRWIVMPEVYSQLCTERQSWNEANRLRVIAPKFFPQYRAPTTALEAVHHG